MISDPTFARLHFLLFLTLDSTVLESAAKCINSEIVSLSPEHLERKRNSNPFPVFIPKVWAILEYNGIDHMVSIHR